MRINARLDEQTAKDLQYLLEATQANTTEILRTALREYAERMRQDARNKKKLWLESGFIGCAKGPEDLSANYKQYLHDDFDEKYPPKK